MVSSQNYPTLKRSRKSKVKLEMKCDCHEVKQVMSLIAHNLKHVSVSTSKL